MGKFFPCTQNLEPTKYLLYVLILDTIMSAGLNILSIIGLIIYFTNDKQIKSGYFLFYGYFKKIVTIILMILLVVYVAGAVVFIIM